MAVNNQLAPRQNPAPAPRTFSAFMAEDAIVKKVNSIIGGKDGQRFISAIVSAVNVNPALQECDHYTILSAAMLGESLKLSPSPQLGMYYMVPYEQKAKYDRNGNLISPAKKVATFQMGYKGYVQLAIRSGEYRKLNVIAIKEGELEYFDPLNEEIKVNLKIDNWDERESLPTIGYYAMFELHDGFRKAIYWSKKQMICHADKYSQAFSKDATSGKYPKVSFEDYEAGNYPEKDAWKYSSFWYKNFDAMAYKTMLIQLISKWGPKSEEFKKAYEGDMAAINEDGTYNYVDNAQEFEQPENVIDVDADTVHEEQGQEPFTEAEKAEIEAQEAAEAAAEAQANFFEN